MMDTPLLVILNFMEAMLPTPPEEIVATLLDQVKGKA